MNATTDDCACPEPGAEVVHQPDVIVVQHQSWCPLPSVRIGTGNRTERKVQRLVKEALGRSG